MSQISVPTDAGGTLVVGWDGPFDTYFAQLYDYDYAIALAPGGPVRACGYHPSERTLDPDVVYDEEYPVATPERVLELVADWDLSEGDLDRAEAALRDTA